MKQYFVDWKLVATKTFQLSICVALAVAAPYFLNQLITGSIVNALLFISASTLGLESAFLLCLIPSLISIYTGLFPLALAPMIPFIMTGNALLVLAFYFLGKKYWVGAVSACNSEIYFYLVGWMVLAESVLHGIAPKVMLDDKLASICYGNCGCSNCLFVLKGYSACE